MKKNLKIKILVSGILLLFLGLIILPTINAQTMNPFNNFFTNPSEENDEHYSSD